MFLLSTSSRPTLAPTQPIQWVTVYFINPSHQSWCLYVYPFYRCNGSVKCIPAIVARQWIGKHVPAATNKRNNWIIVGPVIFFAARVLSKGSMWFWLCFPLSLLGNNSVKTFPRQRRIVGGVVFYVVLVVSKKSRRLVLPRISCYITFPPKLNSVALVRERTISTERPPLVCKVSANFCGQNVSRGQRNGFPRSLISVF
jgi:hypothetical protein